MKSIPSPLRLLPALFLLVIASAPLPAQTASNAVELDKARELNERRQRGEILSAEDRTRLDRGTAVRTAQPDRGSAASDEIDWPKARELFQRSQRSEQLTPEEQTYLNRALAARRGQQRQSQRGGPNQRPAPERLIPLTDMTADDRYEGQDGGLYGGGKNTPPDAHRRAAEAQLVRIQPLDASGAPAPDGKIVFVSISMSNATQEFSVFKRMADAAPQKSKRVTIVDCAQGGQAMAEWAPRDARPWAEAAARLQRAGVTPEQVQVAWIKLANKVPRGSFEDHTAKLASDTLAVLHNARSRFPNLRVAYLGSRIWAGNAKGALNPEPYAYESAFVVRSLIQRQMKGEPDLGEDKSPLLLWGPYLWAEGEKGRKVDDLIWAPGDFTGDGVHPSDSGRAKVARLLLDFYSTDPLAKRWFTGE